MYLVFEFKITACGIFIYPLRFFLREDNILPYSEYQYFLQCFASPLAFPRGEGGPLAVDEEIGILKAKHRGSDNKRL